MRAGAQTFCDDGRSAGDAGGGAGPLAPVVFGGMAPDTALTLVASLALDRLYEGEDNPDC
jgi:hypothetical protein